MKKNREYFDLLLPIWTLADKGEIELFTSELSLLETLVYPIRENDSQLVHSYEQILTRSDIHLIPVTYDILYSAAQIRAKLNLRTPDAIHAATSIAAACDNLLTNDNGFRRITTANVVVLNELI